MRDSWNLLTTEQAAAWLEIAPDAVRRYYHSGILAGRMIGRRIMVEQRAVQALQQVVQNARLSPAKPPAPVAKNPPLNIDSEDLAGGDAGADREGEAVESNPSEEGGSAGDSGTAAVVEGADEKRCLDELLAPWHGRNRGDAGEASRPADAKGEETGPFGTSGIAV